MSRLHRLAQLTTVMVPPQGQARDYIRGAGIDVMGCILCGAEHPLARQTREALGFYPGSSPIFGAGQKTAAPFAALCNAVAGHTSDFDDWEEPGNTHPSVIILPALWALAAERGASGSAVAAAYAAGFEAIARLGEALNFEHYNRGWHSTATLGVVGVAAATSRLLNLDAKRTTNALSLALSQASGYTCQFGSDAKPLQAGFAARSGVIAGLLAERGASGKADVLDGPTGFINLMAHGKLARLDRVLEAMDGRALERWGIITKPYPSCGYTHRLIDCALELAGRVEASKVSFIKAELPDFHYAILPYDRPQSRSEALFSVPFCVATALLRGGLGLADFGDAARAEPALKAMIEKIEVAPQPARRPSLNYDSEQPDRLHVTLSSGATFSASCAYPKGAPQNPMSLAELRVKLESIAGPYPASSVDQLIAWDNADDINVVLNQFGDAP